MLVARMEVCINPIVNVCIGIYDPRVVVDRKLSDLGDVDVYLHCALQCPAWLTLARRPECLDVGQPGEERQASGDI